MTRLVRPGPHVVASAAVLLAAAVVVVVIAVRQVWGDDARLVSRTDGSTSGASSAPGARQYYSVYVGQVCVSGAGRAQIRSVEPVDPQGGLEVTDFSVRSPQVEALGASHGRLRDQPGFRGSRSVSDLCDRGAGTDLIIEAFKPRAEDAWAHEYRIEYDLNGESRSERVRFGFGLCEKDLDHCNHSEDWSADSRQ